jgi:hypothetical protein
MRSVQVARGSSRPRSTSTSTAPSEPTDGAPVGWTGRGRRTSWVEDSFDGDGDQGKVRPFSSRPLLPACPCVCSLMCTLALWAACPPTLRPS